jgi:hypothetical protein
MITLCNLSEEIKPGQKLNDIKLIPHWNLNELNHISPSYSDWASHNADYFLLAVEEARESVTHNDSSNGIVNGLLSSSSVYIYI